MSNSYQIKRSSEYFKSQDFYVLQAVKGNMDRRWKP